MGSARVKKTQGFSVFFLRSNSRVYIITSLAEHCAARASEIQGQGLKVKLQTSWKLIGGEAITAGIYLGDLLIGKVVRTECPTTGAISFELLTLGGVRQFAELPDAMRVMGIDGPLQSRHAAISKA